MIGLANQVVPCFCQRLGACSERREPGVVAAGQVPCMADIARLRLEGVQVVGECLSRVLEFREARFEVVEKLAIGTRRGGLGKRGGEAPNRRRGFAGCFDHAFEVLGDESEEAFVLAPIEPDDGRKVLLLLGREVVDLARHLPVDVAGVDHQHLPPPLDGLGLVEEPQLARHRTRVEETGADRHHHVQVARLDQLPAHLRFPDARRRRLRGHDEPGPARVVQVAVEVGDPEVVAVGDLALLVHPRKGIAQAWVVLHLLRVHFVDVERRIGHDEVALAEQLVRVLVVSDGLVDIALKAVHGEVHVGEANRRRVLLHAEERRPFGRVEVHAFDEVRALHEHPARSRRPGRARGRGPAQ